MSAPLFAWLVTIPKWWPTMESLYAAPSRAAARHMCVASALEAGFGVRYGDVRVVRAPEHDGVALKRGAIGWRDGSSGCGWPAELEAAGGEEDHDAD